MIKFLRLKKKLLLTFLVGFEVYRPSEAGSFSMEPYGEDGEGSNTPPPYSGPITSSKNMAQPSQTQLVFLGLLRLDYRTYSPQSFSLSSDLTTITSYDPRFSASPAALMSLIQSLTTVPPKPIIRIRGKNSTSNEVDFDVKLNMMNLIVPETEKGRMNYVKLIGPGELGFRGDFKETTAPTVSRGLEEWASKFCSDPSSVKEYIAPSFTRESSAQRL